MRKSALKVSSEEFITPPGSGLRPPQQDSVWVKLGLTLFGTLLVLALLEFSVRLLGNRVAPQPWTDRPTVSYVPESSPDNRNFPYLPKKTPGTFRIVVLGDSFTFAGKVHFDDNFATRLGRMLNLNDRAPKVEVLNWGVPGFSTFHERELARKAVMNYEPDVLILEITLNDPELKPFGSASNTVEKRREKTLGSFLGRHWKTYALIMNRVYNSMQNREYLEYHRKLFEASNTWNGFASSLEKIGEMADHHQIPVVAVIFPFFTHPFDSTYPFAAQHEKILAKLAETSIKPLDLRPFYAGIPPERLQAVPGVDAHPNEIAHRIAADAIYAKLAGEQLIPAENAIKVSRPGGRRLPRAIFKGKVLDSSNDDLKNDFDSAETTPED